MRMVSVSSSSDDEDPEKRLARIRLRSLRMSPPDNELPGVVPISLVLGRTDEVVVALTAAQVYSTGVSLAVSVRLRHSEEGGGLFEQVHGHRRGRDAASPLLLGVGYADGRTATNIADRLSLLSLPSGSANDDAPLLVSGSGGGDDRSVEVSFWLWPLPSEGDLTLVCAWPARGIAETHAVLSAAALASAAAAVQELWPWQPQPDHAPTEHAPAAPELPDGWFKEALRPE